MKSRIYVFTVSLLILGFLASCATPGANSTQKAVNRPLVVGVVDQVGDMDPGKNWGWEGTFLALMYDSLFTAVGSSNPTIQPWLATEIPTQQNGGISADGLVYTIHIKPGVKFHDGTPLDANAVIYSYTRQQKLATGVDAVTADWISKMVAVDPLTVQFTLTQPFGNFLWSMSSAWGNEIVNPALVQQHLGKLADGTPDYGSTWLFDHEAGSGPYSMVSVDKTNNTLTLARNPAWFHGWPSNGNMINQIIIRTNVDSENARLMLEKGDIDMALTLDATDFDAIKSTSGIITQTYPSLQQDYIGFDNASPKLKDVRVRQALLYSFPYTEVQKDIFHGYLLPMVTASGPAYPEVYTPQTVYTQDLGKAKSLLAAAGYTPQNPLELTIDTIHSGWPEDTQVAEDWQPVLAGIGVKLDIKELDHGVWGKSWWGCTAPTDPNIGEMSAMGISGDYPSAWETLEQVYPLASGSKCTAVYINDSNVNQLFTKIAAANDAAARKPLLENLYQTLNQNAYALQVGEEVSLVAYRDSVKGYDYSFSLGDPGFPAYAMWLTK